MNASGRLVCVGLGISPQAHLTSAAKHHIEQSDIVFADVPHARLESWLKELHGDVRSLRSARSDRRPRMEANRKIVQLLLAEVRNGKSVCAAFYGHSGAFGGPAQLAVQSARREGFDALMEPGISAADCLYADLGIDPIKYGCQHYEASQLMRYRRSLDSSAYLVLWNIDSPPEAIVAEANVVAYRKVLVDVLAAEYPQQHSILVYHPADSPQSMPKIARLSLALLPTADIGPHACVVIPPAAELLPDTATRARLATIESA
jgi:precorrin-6B methylase 1